MAVLEKAACDECSTERLAGCVGITLKLALKNIMHRQSFKGEQILLCFQHFLCCVFSWQMLTIKLLMMFSVSKNL